MSKELGIPGVSKSVYLVPLPSPASMFPLQVRDEAAAGRVRREREAFQHQGSGSLEKSLVWGLGPLPFI